MKHSWIEDHEQKIHRCQKCHLEAARGLTLIENAVCLGTDDWKQAILKSIKQEGSTCTLTLYTNPSMNWQERISGSAVDRRAPDRPELFTGIEAVYVKSGVFSIWTKDTVHIIGESFDIVRLSTYRNPPPDALVFT